MPGARSRKRYQPPEEVIAIGEKFFQYLRSTGHHEVTDKGALRSLYYDEFKPSLRGDKACSFSNLIYRMKRSKKIQVKYGHVHVQRAYDSVTIDQYTTIRKSEDLGGQGSLPRVTGGGGMPSGQHERYPCLCEVCGMTANSEVQYVDHIQGKLHRVNMLKKFLNSKRDDLVQNKHGVSITTPYDDDRENVTAQMQRETTEVVEFKIESIADKDTALISIALLKPRSEFSVKNGPNLHHGNEITIPQGYQYKVQLSCSSADNLGRLDSPIVFAFRMEDTREIFQILRFVSVTVVSDVIADLPPSKPYTKPPRFAAKAKRGEIVDGIQLSFSKNNPLKGMQLGYFDIPRDLQKIVNSKRNLPQLRDELKEPLTVDNHKEKFNKLLHIEELQMWVDIRRYDKNGQTLAKDKQPNMLRLHVPGLAENRPSVLRGDHLFARFSDKSDNKSYKGYVHRVEQEDLVLGFHQDFKSKYIQGRKVDIEFTFSRFPIRNQHQAVETATKDGRLSDALFPERSKIGTKGQLVKMSELQAFKRTLFDKKLSTNMEQVQAVHQIVAGTARPVPYLIFGPPGTGKTVTIVEAAKQVYKLLPESRILVSTPSNSAADLVAVRLLKSTPLDTTQLLRLYAPSRALIALDPVLKEKKCCNLGADDLYVPTKEEIATKRIIVTTLVTAGRLALAQFPQDFFTHVFIDEAGHATEPEALIALAGILNLDNPKGGQVILAGDPKQLGPVLRSPHAIENGLALSYLERLMTRCPAYGRETEAGSTEGHYDQRILTKLLQNYRSHPDILKLPNQMFYDQELKVFADELVRQSFCTWDQLPKQGFPVIFHGVEGQDEREEQSPSFFNKSEIEIVVDYVKKVMEKRGGQKIKQDDIGVISPYRKQVEKLRQVLKNRRYGYGDIKVGSVEEFQGQERTVIIISTVRSTKAEYIQMDVDFKLGFLKNPKRFNVAVTRAKALLIIVGNPFMLSKDEHWNQMLEFCIQKGGYRGCTYNAEENDVDEIIQILKKVHLGNVPTVEEAEELGFSHVAQQNDPAWRGEN